MYAHPKAGATAADVQARLKRMALRDDVPTKGFPYELPAVKHLAKLQFHGGASIFQLGQEDIRKVAFNDVFSVDLWRRFLSDPQRYVREVLADDE